MPLLEREAVTGILMFDKNPLAVVAQREQDRVRHPSVNLFPLRGIANITKLVIPAVLLQGVLDFVRVLIRAHAITLPNGSNACRKRVTLPPT